ncbi:MAG: hypothetical protein ACKVX9_12375 [Blastocatellia bacterium]
MQRSIKKLQEHDAFISYSHRADSRLAPAIESGLEKLAKPLLKLRAMDIFRDETSLAANPGLWAGIVEHLAGSRWFVLMASPTSAASHWCNQEILWWVENRGTERMLIILTEGEIAWDAQTGDFDWTLSTALAPALKGRFPGEPLYVDLRWGRQEEKLTLSDSRFRSAVLDLAAPIRDVPKDQLDGEDVRQVRRNKLLARAGVAAIAIAAVIAAWQAIVATQQRKLAEAQRDSALSRQLAAQAIEMRIQKPVLSLLLSAQALAASPTTEASTSLLRALKAAPFDRIVDHPDPFWSLAVSQDGRSAVVGDGQAATHRVDLSTGAIQTLARLPQALGTKATLAVAVSPDGGSVASGGFDQVITIWREGGEQRIISPGAHEGFILGLAFSPDGLRLASAGSDGRVLIHDLAAGGVEALKTSWTPEMSCVRFSPDGRWLAAGGDNGALWLTSLAGRNSPAFEASGAGGSVQDIHFTRDANKLFCAYADGWIALFDIQSGKLSERIETRPFSELRAMTVTSDGLAVVTGHSDGSVVVWRRKNTWSGKTLYRHAAEVTGVALLPDGRRVVSAGLDGRLFVSRPFDLPLAARERAGELAADTAPAKGDTTPPGVLEGRKAWLIASHPERRAFADKSGRIVILPRREGARGVEIPTLGESAVYAGAFSPNGRTLYALCEGQVLAWDSDTGQPRGEPYRLATGLGPRISTSMDGKLVAVATGTAIDFSAAGRRERFERVVLLHAEGLRLLADDLEPFGEGGGILSAPPMFAPDGKLLAVSSESRVTMWDISTLKRLDEAIELPPFAKALGFTGNGRQFLLGLPGKGSILELELAPRAWAAEACRLAGRALTQKEWSAYVSPELPYAPACNGGSFASRSR